MTVAVFMIILNESKLSGHRDYKKQVRLINLSKSNTQKVSRWMDGRMDGC